MSIKGTFIGLATVDIQFYIDVYPEKNTKNKSERYTVAAGGPASNAAIAFAALGGHCELITVLGNNHFSDFVRDDLERNHVHVIDVMKGKENTPIVASIITSKNGDRTVFSHTPANNYHLHKADNFNKKTDIILADGFYVHLAKEAIQSINKETKIVFDGGSWKPGTEELLPLIDIAICSDNFNPPGCTSKNDVIEFLQKYDIKEIAITRGGDTIIYTENDENYSLEVPGINAIDTLGAGDFFHGAFVYYYGQTKNFVNSLKEASNFAAETCKYFGTRDWIHESFPYYNR